MCTLEKLHLLEQAVHCAESDGARRRSGMLYRTRIFDCLETYIGPVKEIPPKIKSYLLKENFTFEYRTLQKTQIWYLVGFFYLNGVPKELGDMWAMEFKKINSQHCAEWDDAWRKHTEQTDDITGYFNYDMVSYTAKYVKKPYDTVEDWKAGNWSNTEGRDFKDSKWKKRSGDFVEDESRSSKFQR